MPNYKIVYSAPVDGASITEFFAVECREPLVAVKAYVKFRCGANAVTAKVYPADDVPLMEIGVPPPGGDNVDNYDDDDDDDKVPNTDSFACADSSWIEEVSWDRCISSLTIRFSRGGCILYKSDWITYNSFKTWVTIAGGSAGEYYNKNIKGLPVIMKT